MVAHLRCYQPKVAVSDDRAIVVEILAVVPGSVAALGVVATYHHHVVILGIGGNPVACSADLCVAVLRRGRRVVYHDIVNEPILNNNSRSLIRGARTP